jgi:hypothetical protein
LLSRWGLERIRHAVWTPDGRAVVFVLLARADTGLYWMPVDGSRCPERLVRTGDAFTPSFSGDAGRSCFKCAIPSAPPTSSRRISIGRSDQA